MVLDIGCFSERQRLEQMKRGLLKPCPTDEELFKVIDACQGHRNLALEISGIAGLPFASLRTLEEGAPPWWSACWGWLFGGVPAAGGAGRGRWSPSTPSASGW